MGNTNIIQSCRETCENFSSLFCRGSGLSFSVFNFFCSFCRLSALLGGDFHCGRHPIWVSIQISPTSICHRRSPPYVQSRLSLELLSLLLSVLKFHLKFCLSRICSARILRCNLSLRIFSIYSHCFSILL